METGDQLFSLLLRRKLKEKVFKFGRREWGWIWRRGLLSIRMVTVESLAGMFGNKTETEMEEMI